MSDNLLGYNPMSNQSSTNKNIKSKPTASGTGTGAPGKDGDAQKPSGPAIGVDSFTDGGGVWAQTNAKKDKLGELRMELNFDAGQRSLDDAANKEQQFDLWLVDGIRAVVSFVDGVELRGECVQQLREHLVTGQAHVSGIPCLDDFYTLLREFQEVTIQQGQEGKCQIGKGEYEKHLNNLMTHVEQIRLHHPAAPPIQSGKEATGATTPTAFSKNSTKSNSQSSLLYIRDIMEYTPPNEPTKISSKTPAATAAAKTPASTAEPSEMIPASLEKDLSQPLIQPLTECSEYFRILLLQACLLQLSTQWDDLMKISDADQDRAATKGETIANLEYINVITLHRVLEAFGTKGCVERTESLWNLMDRDEDGLLDQVEMNQVVYMSLKPVEAAMRTFVEDCIEVWPLRGGFPLLEDDSSSFAAGGGEEVSLSLDVKKKGRYKKWKEEKKEKKTKKVLLKLLDKAIKRHFDTDVEIPHRLRCCYAWADKKHQDGNVQSVLVENSNSGASGDSSTDAASSSGGGGGFMSARKRFVELDPKISYAEFRDVQKQNFPHLDRIAHELCTGFKEEVWILQGKGRQDAETRKEALAFLGVVSLIDMAIVLT